MRFLIAFAAVLGYAAAGLIAPLGLPLVANAGDIQAAHIDASVVAQDHARAIHEGQARAAEAALQHNTEAVRTVAETSRNIHENAYWNSVAAGQNLVAAAQSQAAALDGHAAAARAAHLGYGAPIVAAPYGLGLGHLGYAGLGLHGW